LNSLPIVVNIYFSCRYYFYQAWLGLHESAIIDEKTDTLEVRFAVYNARDETFGSGKMTFEQTRSGLLNSVLEVVLPTAK
jgi:hypothetical protein